MTDQAESKRPLVPLFSTGVVVATPGALRVLQRFGVDPLDLLSRHVYGDWGELCEEDRQANQRALLYGGRLLSSYPVGPGPDPIKVWVITEADRRCTTALRSEDY